MNVGLGTTFLLTLFLLVYVGKKVLKPFHNMTNLSYELAKGNLSTPIKEEKSKFFGRFLWGMDMLRENLESNKEKELALQKEKKTLILSLSHDIKTPLSAIKLYTKALSQNLYDTEEKRAEALQGIDKNVKEIEKYVSEIVAASREDFLNLEVQVGEVYLSQVMSTIQTYYQDKLSTLHTKFLVEDMEECLLKADKDRLVEVLQNMLENAIKYGDGKEIRITLREEEDCKLLSVENTGCSLKEEELPNLFDSFYRGSNSQGVKGSGLGLYICRELMKKMDGEVFTEIRNGSFLVTAVIQKA
ncbi:MAG: HAMP domain-containing histidine kinase [Lachnospiraceae bacterium]|nr:HAMP domain-containing histidine kinase [Lachnospiraceae bacterium]